MSTVGTTSHDGSVVDLNMGDLEVLSVKTLSFTVSLQVGEENEEELASSLRPSALVTRSLHHVSLGMTTNTTIVTSESNSLLVSDNVIEITLSLDEGHTTNGTAHFTSVLEVNGEVGTASLTTYMIINKYLVKYSSWYQQESHYNKC